MLRRRREEHFLVPYFCQIGQILVKRGHVTEAQLMLALGRQSGLEVVDLTQFEPQAAAIEKVDVIASPTGSASVWSPINDLTCELSGSTS